jgi:hypothetical protein
MFDLTILPVSQLLDLHNRISQELYTRNIIRTGHVVAEYCEWLAARALNLVLATAIMKGYDATDEIGRRYQIKGRRQFQGRGRRINGSGPITSESFDYLVIVLLNADFTVHKACVAPVDQVAAWPIKFNANAWTFRAADSLWLLPDVSDVSDLFRSAAGETTP